ncbi:MAG: hypothetical protein AB7H86_09275 [Blastocatellales bacterium]
MSDQSGGIAVILPRGEAIRNLYYTGALDEIGAGTRLCLLSIEPDSSLWTDMKERFPGIHPLREITDRWPVRFIREELDLAHGRWLWSRAAQVRWEWREQEAVTAAMKFKRTGKKLVGLPFANPRGLDLLTGLESELSRRMAVTGRFHEIFRRERPALVFNASHVHSRVALPVVHAARDLDIPTATFIFSWDNLTSQGRIYPPYDHYFVWNEKLKTDLLRIYPDVRPEQVRVTGTPQFDFHFRPEFQWTREEFCARIGADPRRPIVLYSTGMANHVIGEPWVAERIADLLAGMPELGPPQLMVRVLPKGPQGHFDELRRRRKDILIPAIEWERRWLTPSLDDVRMLTSTLLHCSLGINIASTISLELCMFDKPVINVAFPPPNLDREREFDYTRYYQFEHYRPVVESGAIDMAGSEDELRRMILAAFSDPGKRARERRALLDDFFDRTLDGQSASRMAGELLAISRKTNE